MAFLRRWACTRDHRCRRPLASPSWALFPFEILRPQVSLRWTRRTLSVPMSRSCSFRACRSPRSPISRERSLRSVQVLPSLTVQPLWLGLRAPSWGRAEHRELQAAHDRGRTRYLGRKCLSTLVRGSREELPDTRGVSEVCQRPCSLRSAALVASVRHRRNLGGFRRSGWRTGGCDPSRTPFTTTWRDQAA